MGTYKGFAIQVFIAAAEEQDFKDGEKEEIEKGLALVITKYLEAFGEIPKPMVDLKDDHNDERGTVQDAFYNFHDMDGDTWTIRYVRIYHDRIEFIMCYAL